VRATSNFLPLYSRPSSPVRQVSKTSSRWGTAPPTESRLDKAQGYFVCRANPRRHHPAIARFSSTHHDRQLALVSGSVTPTLLTTVFKQAPPDGKRVAESRVPRECLDFRSST